MRPLLALLAILAILAAPWAAVLSGCGPLNTASTTYTLNQSFTTTATPCIVVNASNVVIDGAGFQVKSTSAYDIIGGTTSRANITIKNIVLNMSQAATCIAPAANAWNNTNISNVTFYLRGTSASQGEAIVLTQANFTLTIENSNFIGAGTPAATNYQDGGTITCASGGTGTVNIQNTNASGNIAYTTGVLRIATGCRATLTNVNFTAKANEVLGTDNVPLLMTTTSTTGFTRIYNSTFYRNGNNTNTESTTAILSLGNNTLISNVTFGSTKGAADFAIQAATTAALGNITVTQSRFNDYLRIKLTGAAGTNIRMFDNSSGTNKGNYYTAIGNYNVTDGNADGFGDGGSEYPLSTSTAPWVFSGSTATFNDSGPIKTASDPVGCGDLNRAGQTYTMTANAASIVMFSAENCVSFNKNNTVLDCAGYSLTESSNKLGYLIGVGSTWNTTVKNCVLSGTRRGISGDNLGNNLTITNVNQSASTNGIINTQSNGTIQNSNISVSGSAITLSTNNQLIQNGYANGSISASGDNVLISNMVVDKPNGVGVTVSGLNTNITGSTITASSYGIQSSSGSTPLRITSNTVTTTGTTGSGIYLSYNGACQHYVIGNTVTKSNSNAARGAIETAHIGTPNTIQIVGNTLYCLQGGACLLLGGAAGSASDVTANNNIYGLNNWIQFDVAHNPYNATSHQGNAYFKDDGTPSWYFFNCNDQNGDGWADNNASARGVNCAGPGFQPATWFAGAGVRADLYPAEGIDHTMVSACWDMGTENGFYYVNQTITSNGASCLKMTPSASNNQKFLDCQGNTIKSNNTANTYALNATVGNFIVQNCVIQNFSKGVVVDSTATGGLNPWEVTGSTITIPFATSCSVTTGECSGIFTNAAAGGSRIYSNTINTSSNAVVTKASSGNAIYSNNIYTSVGANAIYLNSTSDAIYANTIRPNTSGAINLTAGASGTSIYSNTIMANQSATTIAVEFQGGSASNYFYQNNITAPVWIKSASALNNFNYTNTGNIYYFRNGTGAWQTFNVTVFNPPGWATHGNKRPFNATTVGGNWSGSGSDWYPWTANGQIMTCPVGTASSWIWKSVVLGDNVLSGNSTTAAWQAFSPGSGRYLMNGSASSWAWLPE